MYNTPFLPKICMQTLPVWSLVVLFDDRITPSPWAGYAPPPPRDHPPPPPPPPKKKPHSLVYCCSVESPGSEKIC